MQTPTIQRERENERERERRKGTKRSVEEGLTFRFDTRLIVGSDLSRDKCDKRKKSEMKEKKE